MKITIQYHAQAKAAVGSGQETLELADGADVPQLLRQLIELHGDAVRSMIGSALLFLGERQVRSDSATRLREGDVLTLVSPISGG